MRVLARFSTALLVTLAGAACASGGGAGSTAPGGSGGAGASEHIPASSATVRAVTEMLAGPPAQQRVSVQNNSTVPIVVTDVVTSDCVNLGRLCDTRLGGLQRIIRVRPGQREVLSRTGSSDPEGTFGYRVQWAWRPDVGDLTAPAELTRGEVTITSANGRTQARVTSAGMETESEAFPPAVGEALRRNVGRLRVTPDSIEMRVGETRGVGSFRVELVDDTGTRFGRAPFGFRIPSNELAFRPPNLTAVAPGRVVVEFTAPARLYPGISRLPAPAQLIVVIRQ